MEDGRLRKFASSRRNTVPRQSIGRRRTSFAEAPDLGDVDIAGAMIEREPVTIVVSAEGLDSGAERPCR